MLLALDVGNTQTVIGLFASGDAREALSPGRDDEAAAVRRGREGSPPGTPGDLVDLLQHWRLATIAERTADEYALLVTQLLDLVGLGFTAGAGGDGVDGIVVSSSVPDVTSAIREMAHTWFEVPLVVIEPGIRTGMPILYDNPKDVGADRIANAVGALDLYGGPAIIVDMGTATTFDAISAAGEYAGGAITPGNRDQRRRALRARCRAAPRRACRASQRDRQVDRRVDPVRGDLRLQRARRRHVPPYLRGDSDRRRSSPQAGSPAS